MRRITAADIDWSNASRVPTKTDAAFRAILADSRSVAIAPPARTTSSPWRRRAAAQEASSSAGIRQDRKSTRLNSSHSQISYAVFCLKQKTILNVADAVHVERVQADFFMHRPSSRALRIGRLDNHSGSAAHQRWAGGVILLPPCCCAS